MVEGWACEAAQCGDETTVQSSVVMVTLVWDGRV